MNSKNISALFGGFLILASSAHATDSLGVAGTFNDFIFNQATASGGGEAEGAIAVGGIGLGANQVAFTAGGGYDILSHNDPATVGALTSVGLYVNGNVDFTSGGQMGNSGNAYVSGNFVNGGGPYNFNGGGALYYGGTLSGSIQNNTDHQANDVSSSVFASAQTSMKNLSTAIGGLAPTAGLLNNGDPNNWSLNIGSHSSATTYVLDLTASQLSNNVTLGLGDLSSNDTLLINVTGGNVNSFGVSINANGLQNRILWNYTGSGTFTVNDRQMEGSLLAPSATVDQSIVIEGNLIANDWNMTGGVENHSYDFNGFVPATTPEPSAYATFALGGLGLIIRRRSSKK